MIEVHISNAHRCQGTPGFTSYGDTQFCEVSRNGAAPGR